MVSYVAIVCYLSFFWCRGKAYASWLWYFLCFQLYLCTLVSALAVSYMWVVYGTFKTDYQYAEIGIGVNVLGYGGIPTYTSPLHVPSRIQFKLQKFRLKSAAEKYRYVFLFF